MHSLCASSQRSNRVYSPGQMNAVHVHGHGHEIKKKRHAHFSFSVYFCPPPHPLPLPTPCPFTQRSNAAAGCARCARCHLAIYFSTSSSSLRVHRVVAGSVSAFGNGAPTKGVSEFNKPSEYTLFLARTQSTQQAKEFVFGSRTNECVRCERASALRCTAHSFAHSIFVSNRNKK